ncbi:EAL domain-containing protein [Sulfuricurvum sp. IAE1]|uniref:EAL and HDOD domain-containing protein n=1 Tax=Sulfuricurvum sp. IAE1 TaxID=2546102 RepID=UPI001051D6AA|nr:EAL domain-containing protein [Sulfuricurvum sp. IAE1]MDD3770351.1 EAL domain-containing protein [Sulfuricurvum sp.]MDX9965616.1 EAL domain-containing protein [Sulfuricurvum sp.]TDA69243.1 EAL domain-containing protein [Sulfuricurvum sp. IAE1]
MGKLYLAKQKIFSNEGNVFAYELLFRDSAHGIAEFPGNMKATSQIIINTLTNLDIDQLLGKTGIAFINVDEQMLTSGVVDVLDKKRFVLELLETIELNDKVIDRIKAYHRKGYTIAIDDFDCSVGMIKKFAPLMKYVHIIKIDVIAAETPNIETVMAKLRSSGIQFLAEKIETKEEHDKCRQIRFDYFQGYHLHKPEVIEVDGYKEVTHLIILQLIRLIKDDAETNQIEMFIKQRADLSYKLIKFLNNQESFSTPVESITQVITLLGRDKLLRWLLVYLYAEISTNPASQTILQFALNRAERMEDDAHHRDKEKAYLAGMFSLLGAVFDTNIKELMNHVKMDSEITRLVVEKKGKFAHSLLKAEKEERDYLRKIVFDNFDRIDPVELIYALEYSGIHVDKARV